MDMKNIVIIPALNPDDNLEKLAEKNIALGQEVIVVNDGSLSRYNAVFERLKDKCTVLEHAMNLGKGEAIKTALRYIKDENQRCDYIGIMDADGQHLPEDMAALLKAAARYGSSLILGSRTINNDVPWKSRMGNIITRKMFHMVSGQFISDTQTGLRAFPAGMLELMSEVKGSRYEYEMNVLIICAQRGISMKEVPIKTIYHDRENSCSHFHKIKDSFRIYRDLFKFSASSFSSFILDYGLFVVFSVILPSSSWGVMTANIAARVISAGYNYSMNCRFVFYEKKTLKTALDYLALAAFILVMNSLALEAFTAGLGIPVYTAKIMTECVLFITSWIVQKYMIFRKAGQKGGSGSGQRKEALS